MAKRFSCAETSLALGEPCSATASQVRRWILVEQPGAWGVDAVMESGLAKDVAGRLRAAARSVGARLLVIRRHGRSTPQRRTCFAVVSTADVRRVERISVADPADLLAVDWAPLQSFEPVGGEIVDDPLYLVCTNGSHDTCCARFGRPVAKVLDALVGEQVWEASHFGGDRFAGNLVCLPDGIYYGRVTPADALRLVEWHREGVLDLGHYRGRSFLPFVAQAAEHFVREKGGLTHVDEVLPTAAEDVGEGLFRVPVHRMDGDVVIATVERFDAAEAQQLTCRSGHREHPPRYRLVDLG